jgi:hypothetical protein
MENIKKISQCCEKQAQGSENSELIDVLNDAVNTKDGDNGKQISSIRFINTLFYDDEYNKYEPQLRGWKQNGNIDSYKSDIYLQLSFIEESEEGTEVTKSQYFKFGTLYVTIKPYTYVVKVGLNKKSDKIEESYKDEYNKIIENLTSLLNKKYDKQVSVYDKEFDDLEEVLNRSYNYEINFFNTIFKTISPQGYRKKVIEPTILKITDYIKTELLIGINKMYLKLNKNVYAFRYNPSSSTQSIGYFKEIFNNMDYCVIIKLNNEPIYFSSQNYRDPNDLENNLPSVNQYKQYENVKLVKNQRYLLDK